MPGLADRMLRKFAKSELLSRWSRVFVFQRETAGQDH